MATTTRQHRFDGLVAYSKATGKDKPCDEAREWAKPFKTAKAAWVACERPDWMLWLLGSLCPEGFGVPERRKLAGVLAECSRAVLDNFEKHRPGDTRVRACIELVERFASGDESVTREMLSAAESAAWSAAWSAAESAQCDIIRKHYPNPPHRSPRPRIAPDTR